MLCRTLGVLRDVLNVLHKKIFNGQTYWHEVNWTFLLILPPPQVSHHTGLQNQFQVIKELNVKSKNQNHLEEKIKKCLHDLLISRISSKRDQNSKKRILTTLNFCRTKDTIKKNYMQPCKKVLKRI